MAKQKRKQNQGKARSTREASAGSPAPTQGYIPVFEAEFKEDLHWWARQDRKTFSKALALVEDILDGDPFSGKGKPEPLKFLGAGVWSRRITLEHRLVYRVEAAKVYFLQARYHYD